MNCDTWETKQDKQETGATVGRVWTAHGMQGGGVVGCGQMAGHGGKVVVWGHELHG
jgi:hypothetical protein